MRTKVVVIGVCTMLTACALTDARHEPALTADARLQVAAQAQASGDNELAASMYVQAAAREPRNIELQLRCADALARSGKIDQARQLLSERLRESPDQPELLRALALIDIIAGEEGKAIVGLNQVLARNPAEQRALMDKAVALDLQGQHGAAQAIYRELLARTPKDPATVNNLAVSLMLQGRTREALQVLAPMQGDYNSPQRIKVNLGILYAATGNLEQSRKLLGDRITDQDLATLTRALTASATNAQP